MALFHGVLLCCLVVSVVKFFSDKKLSRKEKRMLERLRKAMRRSARCHTFTTRGTEESYFEGNGRWSSQPNRPGCWGFKQVSELVGTFVRNLDGSRYDFSVTKATDMVTATGETRETARIVTETLVRGAEAFMRFREAPTVFSKVFTDRWFDVREHDLGEVVDVDGLQQNLQLFDESVLDERQVLQVTETPGVTEDGTAVTCIKVVVNSVLVSKSSKCGKEKEQQKVGSEKMAKAGFEPEIQRESKIARKGSSVVEDVVSEGFIDDVCDGASAWTEYLVSEQKGLIVGIRSKARSNRINEKSGDWECDVEVERTLKIEDYNRDVILPNPKL